MQSDKLKPLKTIHLAFCASTIVFAATSFLVVKDKFFFEAGFDQNNGFYPLFPIMGILSILAGIWLFNKQIALIDHQSGLDDKLTKYQVAFLIRAALFEGGALMNIVGFLITGNTVFLITAIFPLYFQIKYRPTKEVVTDTLNLQYPDNEQL